MSANPGDCFRCGQRVSRRYRGQLCEVCRDAPLPTAVTRPRKKRRNSNAFMSRAHVRACYALYSGGLSTHEIGELICERFGYANPRSAKKAVLAGFASEGLPLRSTKDAHRVSVERGRRVYEKGEGFFGRTHCRGCGIEVDSRTIGCPTCQGRHSRRRKKVEREQMRQAQAA